MNTIIKKSKEKVVELCKQFRVKNFYVFGSVTTANFKKNSDIDVLISFLKDLSIKEYTNNYFELHDRLKKFFNRKIDPNFKRTNARKIVAAQNRVIHAYDNVDDAIIWGIVTLHLPELKKEVEISLNDGPK